MNQYAYSSANHAAYAMHHLKRNGFSASQFGCIVTSNASVTALANLQTIASAKLV